MHYTQIQFIMSCLLGNLLMCPQKFICDHLEPSVAPHTEVTSPTWARVPASAP